MYTTEVSLLDLSGTVRLPLLGKLWELYSTFDSQGHVRDRQLENENATVQSGIVSFTDGPSYMASRNHMIGISVEETGASGPLFRSGGYDTLPPGAPADPDGCIEIMVPKDPIRLSTADLTANLPPLPMSLSDGITINELSLELGNGSITLRAGGTKDISPLPAVAFTYTLTFSIEPSFEMQDITTVFDIIPIGAGTLEPPTVALLAGVFGTTEAELCVQVIRALQRLLSDRALSTAAAAVGASTLPAGLVLSVRQVTITPSGVAIFPVVGAYGGILNTFVRDLSDGDLLREMSSPDVFVIYGGAKFHIPDPTVLAALGFTFDSVRTVPDGALALVPNIPRDSTLLRELSGAPVYVIKGGQKCWIPDPATLVRFGGWPEVRVVPDGSLAAIPDGPPIPSVESAECVQIRADITQRRKEIGDLQQAKADLDPRDPQDLAEIRQINAQIARLRTEISGLEQQATALGCS